MVAARLFSGPSRLHGHRTSSKKELVQNEGPQTESLCFSSGISNITATWNVFVVFARFTTEVSYILKRSWHGNLWSWVVVVGVGVL